MADALRSNNGNEPPSPNPFVETTLSYALTYIDKLAGSQMNHAVTSARLIILADNDYYSHSKSSDDTHGRFAKFPVSLKGAHKTGLGSSAALVTSLTAALLTHYLPKALFDISSPHGKRTLHNLAQAAHCAAQGKVGSGFDVAAAVYGSCTYRRFSPDILSSIPEAGAPGFADKLAAVVDREPWDVEVASGEDDLVMPSGVALRMCDVDCGSQTVGMVRKVLAWRSEDAEKAKELWDDLQKRNEALASTLKAGATTEIANKVGSVRELVREMGRLSDVPIEPETQTQLLDALSELDGVYGGVVPGAGGFDALALLVKDDEETKKKVDEFLMRWSSEKGGRVRMLDVKGEMDGVRKENLDIYTGWI